ncbi:MAG: o-succinylbenzoate synthase [Verrucomicrobia bacterium]|nr:o-succinylbenzoate synthase [Verrucomicrobiota bacterium]MBT7066882.1 o-succinylbenzoate synthase [Verrucomicrobiota bacterium]MBT7699830.1 o-succinylbenzoate synthase [Verrucomicrobiota bacterium]
MSAHLHALHAFRLPLQTPLVVGGQTLSERSGLFITLEDGHGARGVGEVAPLPGFHRATTADCLALLRTHRALLDDLPLPPSSPPLALHSPQGEGGTSDLLPLPPLHFGLCMALLNLQAARQGVTPAHLLDPAPLDLLPLNGLVMGPPGGWAAEVARCVDEGFHLVKIKVGRTDPTTEAEALLALPVALRDQVDFILDGNRAWTLDQAEMFLSMLAPLSLRYGEELLTDPVELPELQTRSGVSMALDETLSEPERHADLIRTWPSHLVLKLDRIPGSLATGLALAATARQRGQAAIISSAFNTVVGWSFLVQLGAALHAPHAGLDTQRCFAPELSCAPDCFRDGGIDVARSHVNTFDRLAPYLTEVAL